MINIEFPETNIVKCVFSLRQSSKYAGEAYDEYDHVRPNDLKKYIYRVPSILRGQLKVGDFVVVHCATGYQLCEIVELNVISNFDEKTLAPVVCKVDLSAYIDEVDRAAKLAVMKAELDREKRRLESMVTYEIIAEKNPEFKAMLDAFKDMGGEF